MYQKLLKRTTIYCFVFFVIAMCGMLFYDANKIIVIADSGATTQVSGADSQMKTQYQLLMKNTLSGEDKIIVPLDGSVMAEDVQIQNHYIDKELWIRIQGAGSDFYTREYVTGNLENVVYGGYDLVDNEVFIRLTMDKVYEYESTMSNGKLTIQTQKPKEKYDKIIVLDAGHGGEDMGHTKGRIYETDITLDILLLLQEKLADTGIRVYYTRVEDADVDMDTRLALINGVQADMCISIHTSFSEDILANGVSTIYNGKYFIQDFGSIQLADMLEKCVAGATGAKAEGLIEATEEEMLVNGATVPMAQINVGYLSNEEEKELLLNVEYKELIADGIYNAIIRAYEENLKK